MIWLSAIGHIDGRFWGRGIRVIGGNNCERQTSGGTGKRHSNNAVRFIVRP